MGDLGVQVSVRLFVRLSVRPSTLTMGVLWAQLLLQFFTDLFETLQMFSSWCEDVHVVWILLLDYFLSLFPLCELFRPQCIDSGYLVSATAHTILYQSFLNFAHVFSMVWKCACGLGIILALIFLTFSTLWTLSFSDLRFDENVVAVSTLWAQLLIQFYTNLYETLHMFLPWSGDVHMIWIYSLN